MKKTLLISLLSTSFGFAQIPTDNLLCHMNFNNLSLLEQVSGSNASVAGNMSSVAFATDRFGNADYALSLANANAGPHGVIDLGDINLNAHYSVSYWMKYSAFFSGQRKVMSKREACTSGEFIDFTIDYNNQAIVFETWVWDTNSGDNVPQSFSGALDSPDMWVHVVVTVDAVTDENKYYLNGNLIQSYSWTTMGVNASLNNAASLVLGSSPCVNGSNTLGYEGLLDDFRVYSRPLNDTEVLALYNESDPMADLQEMHLSKGFSIVPNPTQQTATIELNEAESIYIFDLYGMLVQQSEKASFHKVDVSNLANGVYLVRTGSGLSSRLVKH
ncbi:MAG: LamG-like jellyroll fold domain-containing protein [Brumimicrobium sp.]|nr:LamG-like jellyroll fold domain-containing protein [Brumimicrobium sp.]